MGRSLLGAELLVSVRLYQLLFLSLFTVHFQKGWEMGYTESAAYPEQLPPAPISARLFVSLHLSAVSEVPLIAKSLPAWLVSAKGV